MNKFKTMKFVRETRDRMYEETKNKTQEEVREYFKEKARWIDTSQKNNRAKKKRN